MSLTRRERRSSWPPELSWNQDAVDSAFRDMLHSFFGSDRVLDRLLDRGSPMMRLEEYVEDGICVVRAELPGIDPDTDVDIQVVDGMLQLHAERQERSEEKRPDGYHTEFRYGRLSRSIQLPKGVEASHVTASYADGILEVRFPAPQEEPEPSAATKVPIERR